MERITILLPKSTVEMLHLLSRESGKTIGAVVQEMSLDRYMQRTMDSARLGDGMSIAMDNEGLSTVSIARD